MPEGLPDIERINLVTFSDEQRKSLEMHGLQIFGLHGESIASLKTKNEPFWSNWHDGLKMEFTCSRMSEVAIMVDNLFLPKSNNLTVFDQLLLVNKYSQEISKKIPGVHAVMGSAMDYLELNAYHRSEKGVGLFRNFGSFDNAATTTLTPDLQPLFVGESYAGSSVVSYRFGRSGFSDIKVMPLVIPVSS